MLINIDSNGIPSKVFKSYLEVDEDAKNGISGSVVCTNSIKDFKNAITISRYLTATIGKSYIAIDRGSGVSPRFGVIELLSIGDKVSYAFNGDYYPDGEIVKISKTLQITTSTGNIYRRRKNSGAWVLTGGTWCLVSGHRSELNPSF